jgi:uncharacterized membrane protein YidH (DUF202 family)
MNIRTQAALGTAGGILLPLMAFAQVPNTGYFTALINSVRGIVQSLIPLLIGIAVVVFIWGVIKYVTAGASDEKKKEARGLMIWGIIAIFVIVSIWGIVGVIQNITGTGGQGGPPTIPTVP